MLFIEIPLKGRVSISEPCSIRIGCKLATAHITLLGSNSFAILLRRPKSSRCKRHRPERDCNICRRPMLVGWPVLFVVWKGISKGQEAGKVTVTSSVRSLFIACHLYNALKTLCFCHENRSRTLHTGHKSCLKVLNQSLLISFRLSSWGWGPRWRGKLALAKCSRFVFVFDYTLLLALAMISC